MTVQSDVSTNARAPFMLGRHTDRRPHQEPPTHSSPCSRARGGPRGGSRASPNRCLAVSVDIEQTRTLLKAVGPRTSLCVCSTFHGAGQLCARASGTTAGTAAGAPAHTGSALRVSPPRSAGGAAKQGQGTERAATRARSRLGQVRREHQHCAPSAYAPRLDGPCTRELKISRIQRCHQSEPAQEAWTGVGVGVGVCAAAQSAARGSADTHLLRPASTTNCPWGLQKMVLACCLSNISERKEGRRGCEKSWCRRQGWCAARTEGLRPGTCPKLRESSLILSTPRAGS